MFNLIVTCVDSKNYPGPSILDTISELILRGINNDTDELFRNWKRELLEQVKSSSFLPKAQDLYIGSMWNASLEAFRKIREEKRLWIISCGYGFISSGERITGYHATFKPNVKDTLLNKRYFYTQKAKPIMRKWWGSLTENRILESNNPRSINELVNSSSSKDIILVAAGKDYYEAIYNDLDKINISDNTPKMVFLGIKKMNNKFKPNIPLKLEPYVCPFNNWKKLREMLGCNGIQVNPKSASLLIEHYNETGNLNYEFP